MKKKIFGLCLLFTMLFSSSVMAFAEENVLPEENNEITYEEGHEPTNREPSNTIPPSGELSAFCGADGNVNFYLYISDEYKNQVTRIVFLDKETGDEYFYKFNPANYNGENLWVERINIPQGDYFVSCRVSGDTFGSASCKLFPEGRMLVGRMLEDVTCLVGPQEWLDITYAAMKKADEEANAPEPTEAPATPTVAPTPIVKDPEKIPPIELPPEPEPEKKSPVGLYVGAGVVAIAVIFLFTKKKKK